ncbi:hypothetical protein GGR53DRAFT_303308 [Hypoxylon sp. FL1150]|nr:hypothetical protein GGR53DRAFT_303308 [Hypoxylon sp. FL1150]
MDDGVEENQFQEWRSILTLVVFLLVNLTIIFPFHIPFYMHYNIYHTVHSFREYLLSLPGKSTRDSRKPDWKRFIRISIPVSHTTTPLAAVFFLLATAAMTPEELRNGICGGNNLIPMDIVAFALTIGYISGSIDASGLLRYLTVRILRAYGGVGHRLYLYLYCLFFLAGAFFGNDPIIQMGMLVLTYMMRITSDVMHPRAWLFMQYAVINIASTIFVSSGTTNAIIASAFNIGFAEYAANTVIPVFVTALILFPSLLYLFFADVSLIPLTLRIHELPEEARTSRPTNPAIDPETAMSLELILNPFLDKFSALVGIIIMIVTLVVLLAVSAVTLNKVEIPVFWATLPAAFVMLCFDVTISWIHRREIRATVRASRRDKERARVMQEREDEAARRAGKIEISTPQAEEITPTGFQTQDWQPRPLSLETFEPNRRLKRAVPLSSKEPPQPFIEVAKMWLDETFITAMVVVKRLPFSMVPFAIPMFVLVQALAEKGWVVLLARGWDNWTTKTGAVGAIGGMGFIAVILSNFAGTNIGATVLLCRVLQTWQQMHATPEAQPISDRTLWGAVYALALGVNYGAFSLSFGASLAGISWREDLAHRNIRLRRLEFARVNLPIICTAMAIGCSVLVGEVYIMR